MEPITKASPAGRQADIRVFAHEGRTWFPASDIENWLGGTRRGDCMRLMEKHPDAFANEALFWKFEGSHPGDRRFAVNLMLTAQGAITFLHTRDSIHSQELIAWLNENWPGGIRDDTGKLPARKNPPMQFAGKKMFGEVEISIYRYEDKIWMRAHDIERALGLPKEAFDASARRHGKKYGAQAVLFARRVTTESIIDGKKVMKEDLAGPNWKMTCEGARLFAVRSDSKRAGEFVLWADALQAGQPAS